MALPPLRPLSTGEVLDVSFSFYRSIFAPLFLVTAVTTAIPGVTGIFFSGAGAISRHFILYFLNLLLTFFCSSIGQAAVTIIVSNAYLGRSVPPAEALRQALPLVWRLFLISMMVLLVVSVGFGFLIVPGLWLISGLCLSNVIAVIENDPKASKALDRSWALTKGYRMKALLVVLVPGILVYVVPALTVVLLFGILQYTDPIVLTVFISVFKVFFYPFLFIVLAVLYYDLRVRKEGFDLEVLATALPPA